MPDDLVQQVKQRLDILDLVQGYVQLKKTGINWKGLCPFHQEKTPSFTVNQERQSWHCFGCFPKGSHVKTPRGFCDIDQLRAGDVVISGKGQEKSVLTTHRHMYKGELVRISLCKLGGEVALTGDHKVFALRGAPYTKIYKNFSRRLKRYQQLPADQYRQKLDRYFPVEKVEAHELTIGDLLLYPISYRTEPISSLVPCDHLTKTFRLGPKPSDLPKELPITDSLLKLLGYYIAEGSNHRAYIRFSLGGHELKLAKEIQVLLKEVFGLVSSIHVRQGGKPGIEVTCCHAALADIFGNLCGKGAANKHIPFELRHLPVGQQQVLLNAIWTGDGTARAKHRSLKIERSIGSISQTLAEQIVDILLRRHIFPSLQVIQAHTSGDGVKHRMAYTVVWGEAGEDKYNSVYQAAGGTHYWVLPVVHIAKEPFCDEVFNLTIEDDHSYVARNFAVANCGEGGDIFTFVEKIEHVEFKEALELLAGRVGLEVKPQTPVERQQKGEKAKLEELYQLASRFYHALLINHPLGQAARDYLAKRGVSAESVKAWQLGVAPDHWDALLSALQKRGFTADELVKAGLAVKNERGNIYDRFRNRLLFPIITASGQPVAFSGRVITADQEPKYLNSPESLLYRKSSVVMGLNLAKEAIRKAGQVMVVEGNLDVLICQQFGLTNTVATGGTALTSDHLRLLARYAPVVIFAFDADAAGQKAAEKAALLALEVGLEPRFIALPAGDDPDSLLRRDEAAFRQAMAAALPAVPYFLERALNEYGQATAQAKKQVAAAVVPLLRRIHDPVEQADSLQQVADRLHVPREAIESAVSAETKAKTTVPVVAATARRGPLEPSQRLFGLLLLSERPLPPLDPLLQDSPDKTLQFLQARQAEGIGDKMSWATWQAKQPQPIQARLASLLTVAAEAYGELPQEQFEAEITLLLAALRSRVLEHQQSDRQAEIRLAEQAGDKARVRSLLQEMMDDLVMPPPASADPRQKT